MAHNRLKSLDIAKGICILIVLVHHAIGQYGKSGFWGETGMNMYKLSLFFFVSGMFFSTTENFKTFLRKKTKKLIIPFVFFYVLTVIGTPILFSNYMGLYLNSFFGTSLHGLLIQPFSSEVSANGPIWFVWCLLIINFYYYLISTITDRFSTTKDLKYYISFIIGFIGLSLAYLNVNIPAHIDSAMSALPFFALGEYLFHSTDIFSENKYHTNKFLFLSIFILIGISIFAYPVDYRANTFEGLGYLLAYPFGLLGTFSIITISKRILNCNFLNYCGRYSLIILCTHTQIQQFIGYIIPDNWHFYGWKGIIVNTLITIPTCLIICHIFSNYIPSLVGLQTKKLSINVKE